MILLPLQLILLHTPRHSQQLLLFLHMTALQTRGDRSTRIATRVHNVLAIMVLGIVQQGLNSRLREGPGAGVERLFLTPDDCLRVRVAIQVFAELLPWEGVELFDTRNGGISQVVLLAMLEERCEDLARAENDTLDFVVRLDLELCVVMMWVFNDPAEVAFTGKIFNWRSR